MSERAFIAEDLGVRLLLEGLRSERREDGSFHLPGRWSALRGLARFALPLALLAALSAAVGIWIAARIAHDRDEARCVANATRLANEHARAWRDHAARPGTVPLPDDAGVFAELDSILERHLHLDTLYALRDWTVVRAHVSAALVRLDAGLFHDAALIDDPRLLRLAARDGPHATVLELLHLTADAEEFLARYPDPVGLAPEAPPRWEVEGMRQHSMEMGAHLRRHNEWLRLMTPMLYGRATRVLSEIGPRADAWLARLDSLAEAGAAEAGAAEGGEM